MGVGGFNTRSIALTALVVVLIAGLFFIPEILSFRKSLSGAPGQQTAKVTTVTSEVKRESKAQAGAAVSGAETGAEKAGEKSFIDRVMNYFKTEKGTSPVELRESRQYSVPRGLERSAKKAAVQGGKAATADFSDNGASWRGLKSKESVTSLRKAQQEALAIDKSLPSRYRESHQALLAYSSGIRFVLSGGDKSMDALKAFQFLEQLDAAVTDAMLKEKVPSADYNSWTRVSLGPAFAQSKILRLKGIRQKPFNPMLRVVSVRVQQPGNHQGKFVENGKAYLHVVGVVEGRDIARIEVYRDGWRMKDRQPRRPDRNGLRYFFIRGQNARGDYTFRVLDRGGQEYIKVYNFYNRMRAFPWFSRRGGLFVLPLGSFDPRLDRLFALRGGTLRKDAGITYFTSAVGKDFATF